MGRRQVGRHQGTDGRGMATWAQAEKGREATQEKQMPKPLAPATKAKFVI